MTNVYMPPTISTNELVDVVSTNKNYTLILGLDKVADPGNYGSLIRSAAALGWHGVFAGSQCVNNFNDKAIRAARGATFRLPIVSLLNLTR
jgi:tRNA G18 (ribose-2'-O)-methylase SpoU